MIQGTKEFESIDYFFNMTLDSELRKEWQTLKAAVLAQQTTNKRRSAICRWKVDAETCSYDTSCGNKWCFPEGTARDNGLRYCPVCGKRASFR